MSSQSPQDDWIIHGKTHCISNGEGRSQIRDFFQANEMRYRRISHSSHNVNSDYRVKEEMKRRNIKKDDIITVGLILEHTSKIEPE